MSEICSLNPNKTLRLEEKPKRDMDVWDEELRGIEEEDYEGNHQKRREGKRQNRREGKIAPKMERTSPHVFPPLLVVNDTCTTITPLSKIDFFFLNYSVLTISKVLTIFVAKNSTFRVHRCRSVFRTLHEKLIK